MKPDFEYSLDFFLNKLHMTKGIFVDVGANDGFHGSMTLDLENNGWSGVLIEPNPILVEKLVQNRKSPVFQFAVSNSEGRLPFYIVSGPGNIHGLSRFSIDDNFRAHIASLGGSIKEEIVEVKKISSIINSKGELPKVNFLKVDVEGHELAALQGFDFKKYRPELIVTEDNFKDSDKSVRHYLEQNGYKIAARDRINNWFVRSDLKPIFFKESLQASIRFLRWDIKRFFYKIFNLKFKTGNN